MQSSTGAHARDVGGIAADHQRERARHRVRRRSCRPGLSIIAAPLAAIAAPTLRVVRGIDRAHVDVDRAGRNALDDAVRAERDALDVGRVGQHGDHDVARAPRLRAASSRACAPASTSACTAGGLTCRTPSAVPLLQHVAGHRRAHRAQSDESDVHVTGHASFHLREIPRRRAAQVLRVLRLERRRCRACVPSSPRRPSRSGAAARRRRAPATTRAASESACPRPCTSTSRAAPPRRLRSASTSRAGTARRP